MTRRFYEFFAGAGMARAGLGSNWQCVFANDIDLKKATTYDENWSAGVMKPSDVKSLSVADLPGTASLVWASFPCQDLSLAGGGAGLRGERSGVFWPFWRLMQRLAFEGRAPTIVALENVAATLTSHNGRDFEALCLEMVKSGYRVGARIIDAVNFVPQSRPRLFIVAVRADIDIPAELMEQAGSLALIDHRVFRAVEGIRERAEENRDLRSILDGWINWALPEPTAKPRLLDEVLESEPAGVEWHSAAETALLISRMSDVHRRKVDKARETGSLMFGTAYKRTRVHKGEKTVRTEVRFDGVAGCLRTPSGGSSRQIVVEINGRRTRSRLMTAREAARLMGLPESYKLPSVYNEAYHLIGDGVAVPVVDFLARSIFDPLVMAIAEQHKLAA